VATQVGIHRLEVTHGDRVAYHRRRRSGPRNFITIAISTRPCRSSSCDDEIELAVAIQVAYGNRQRIHAHRERHGGWNVPSRGPASRKRCWIVVDGAMSGSIAVEVAHGDGGDCSRRRNLVGR